MDVGTFTVSIFYFWRRTLGAAIFASQVQLVFLLLAVILPKKSEDAGDQSHLLVFLSSLRSSFVLRSARCRAGRETVRCTVKIWQKGNEETLSPTDLDTIQISFARIPATYHLSVFPSPRVIPSLFYCISNHLSSPISFLSPSSTPFSSSPPLASPLRHP